LKQRRWIARYRRLHDDEDFVCRFTEAGSTDIVEQIPNLSETRVSCHCDAAMTLLLERDANHERLPLR